MSPEENKAVAMTFFRAFFAGKGELEDILTDDFVWYLPRSATAKLGRPREVRSIPDIKAVRDGGAGMFNPAVPIRPTVDFVVSEGDVVILKQILTGETAGGVPYENDYVFCLKLRGDRVSELWEFTDTSHFDRLQEQTA